MANCKRTKRLQDWPDIDVDGQRIMAAILAQFPNADADYQDLIFRRFAELYENLPPGDAVIAIARGYSSPGSAMSARVIRRRRYIGFRE